MADSALTLVVGRLKQLAAGAYLYVRSAQLDEVTAPATPGSGIVLMYTKSDHKLYIKDSTGAETSFQPLNAKLTGLASVTAAAFAFPYFSASSGTMAVANGTSAGVALLSASNAAGQRSVLGLGTLATQSGTFSGTSSGTNTGDQDLSPYLLISSTAYEPHTVLLTAFANLGSFADRIPYMNGISTMTTTVFTAAARALVDDADSAAMRTTLGVVDGISQDPGTDLNIAAGSVYDCPTGFLQIDAGRTVNIAAGGILRVGSYQWDIYDGLVDMTLRVSKAILPGFIMNKRSNGTLPFVIPAGVTLTVPKGAALLV